MALARGADEARVIPAKSVIAADWVRFKCQYGCGGYSKRLCCPPRTPTPAETRRVVAEYRHALIYSYTLTPSVYRGRQRKMQRLVAAIERRMFLDGYYKAFGFSAGPCRLCRTCSPDARCRFPYLARPAMEACGIDVYATCRNAGIKLEVVTRRGAPFRHVNLVLIE